MTDAARPERKTPNGVVAVLVAIKQTSRFVCA